MTEHTLSRRLIAAMFTGALSLSLIGAAVAQEAKDNAPAQKGHRRSAKRGHHRMQMLNLTDEQKTKLKEARQAFRQRAEAVRANTSLTDEQKKAELKAARAEVRQALDAILTPEQREKLKASHARRAAGMRGRGRGSRGMARVFRGGAKAQAGLMNELNLTDEQKSKLAAARNTLREQRKALRNASGTPEEKRAQMRQHGQAFRAEVQSILTPEQLEKVKSMRGQRRNRAADAATPAAE